MQFLSHCIRQPQFPGSQLHGLRQNLCESGIEPRSPDHSFDGINTMPFTTLLSAAFYHSTICADSKVVKGIVFISSLPADLGF